MYIGPTCSLLAGLVPALPASVALDDEKHGDQSDSAADGDDAQTAERVARPGPRAAHRICASRHRRQNLERQIRARTLFL